MPSRRQDVGDDDVVVLRSANCHCTRQPAVSAGLGPQGTDHLRRQVRRVARRNGRVTRRARGSRVRR
ncbi:hypothetical protein I547_1241 [Mycobacterium kansasii 824]|nr:hypothetical protein I547_1241 [Mycobacterium kansasii 824]